MHAERRLRLSRGTNHRLFLTRRSVLSSPVCSTFKQFEEFSMTDRKRIAFLGLQPAALLALFLCWGIGLAPRATAQSTTAGSVSGSVSDPTGAMVPKASVELMNV